MKPRYLPFYWALQLWWWQARDRWIYGRIRAHWAQSGGEHLTDEQFGAWIDSLRPREFIYLMLSRPSGDPD